MSTILIKNGNIVTMDSERRIIEGNIFIKNDRIEYIGAESNFEADNIIDAGGNAVIPGFVQTHIHLTQSLLRGQADDLELMDWLKKRIWPLEAAHTAESNYISAKLGIAELIKGGTTTLVDMETVHHTDSSFQAIFETGIRALSGKCMMDYGHDIPVGIFEKTEDSLAESLQLLKKWHMKDSGRIRYAFAPRFVVSCTEELLVKVGDYAKEYNVMVHTHASENRKECEIVEKDRGMRNIEYIHKIGLTGKNLILVHCIWLSENEMKILADTGTQVVHCPGSNMKLASGIAKIPELLDMGVNVSLGADGAPSNNNLDMFREMRLAALLQKTRLLSPTVMTANTVFEMATIGGAKAVGQENDIGSLEIGKKADLAIINLDEIHMTPAADADIVSSLVYCASASDVLTTIVNGKILMENRQLTTMSEKDIMDESRRMIKINLENIK